MLSEMVVTVPDALVQSSASKLTVRLSCALCRTSISDSRTMKLVTVVPPNVLECVEQARR
jgi:hypothetical protein